MGITKAELEVRNKELKARVKELEEKDAASQARIKELEEKISIYDNRTAALEEQIQFYEAAIKSANQDANTQREKVASLEAKLNVDGEPAQPRLSPGCQEFLSQAKQMPKRETIISTDDIIRSVEVSQSSGDDNRFLDSFMARVAQAEPADSISQGRSYFELDGSGDDDDDDYNDDDDGCTESNEGAPYGKSPSGEFLDPDEEE